MSKRMENGLQPAYFHPYGIMVSWLKTEEIS